MQAIKKSKRRLSVLKQKIKKRNIKLQTEYQDIRVVLFLVNISKREN